MKKKRKNASDKYVETHWMPYLRIHSAWGREVRLDGSLFSDAACKDSFYWLDELHNSNPIYNPENVRRNSKFNTKFKI